MAGELLGDPLAQESLEDPFPWEPLLSPLNMVVKAGAGSGWAPRRAGGQQTAVCVLGGCLARLWYCRAARGRQFLQGPSLQVRAPAWA